MEHFEECKRIALFGLTCVSEDQHMEEAGWKFDALSGITTSNWAADSKGRSLLIYWTGVAESIYRRSLILEAWNVISGLNVSKNEYHGVVLLSAGDQHRHALTEMGIFPTQHPAMMVGVSATGLESTILYPETRSVVAPSIASLPHPRFTPCLVVVTSVSSLLGESLYAYASIAAESVGGIPVEIRRLPYSRRWMPAVKVPSLWLYHHNSVLPLEYAGPLSADRIAKFLRSQMREEL